MKKLKKDNSPNLDQIIRYNAHGRKLQAEAINKVFQRIRHFIKVLFKN